MSAELHWEYHGTTHCCVQGDALYGVIYQDGEAPYTGVLYFHFSSNQEGREFIEAYNKSRGYVNGVWKQCPMHVEYKYRVDSYQLIGPQPADQPFHLGSVNVHKAGYTMYSGDICFTASTIAEGKLVVEAAAKANGYRGYGGGLNLSHFDEAAAINAGNYTSIRTQKPDGKSTVLAYALFIIVLLVVLYVLWYITR